MDKSELLKNKDEDEFLEFKLIPYELTTEMRNQLNLAKNKKKISYLRDKKKYHFLSALRG